MDFNVKGSEGSPTFGQPADISTCEAIKSVLRELEGLLTGRTDVHRRPDRKKQSMVPIVSSQARITHNGLATQAPDIIRSETSASTRVRAAEVPQIKSTPDLLALLGINKSARRPDTSHMEDAGTRVEADAPGNSTSPSILRPVSRDEVLRTAAKLESKVNRQPGSSTLLPSVDLDAHISLVASSKKVVDEQPPSLNNASSEKENSEGDSTNLEKLSAKYAKDVGKAVRLEHSTSLHQFIDQLQHNNSFESLKRVPCRYVRIPKDQLEFLERKDSWYEAASGDGAHFANIPQKNRDQLKMFVTKQSKSALPRPQNKAGAPHELSSNVDDNARLPHEPGSDSESNEDEQQKPGKGPMDVCQNSEPHTLVEDVIESATVGGSPANNIQKQPELPLALTAAVASTSKEFDIFDTVTSATDAGPKCESDDESVSWVATPKPELHPFELDVHSEQDNERRTLQLSAHVSPSPKIKSISSGRRPVYIPPSSPMQEEELEIAVPYAVGDIVEDRDAGLDEEEEEELEEALITSQLLPSTARDKNVVQVEQTPDAKINVSETVRHRQGPMEFSNDTQRMMANFSSDPIIPATFDDTMTIEMTSASRNSGSKGMQLEFLDGSTSPAQENMHARGNTSRGQAGEEADIINENSGPSGGRIVDHVGLQQAVRYDHSRSAITGSLSDTSGRYNGLDTGAQMDGWLSLDYSSRGNDANETRQAIPAHARALETQPDKSEPKPGVVLDRQRKMLSKSFLGQTAETPPVDTKQRARDERRRFRRSLLEAAKTTSSPDSEKDESAANLPRTAHSRQRSGSHDLHSPGAASLSVLDSPKSPMQRIEIIQSSLEPGRPVQQHNQGKNESNRKARGRPVDPLDNELQNGIDTQVQIQDGSETQPSFMGFVSAYPQYLGDEKSFARALACLEWLEQSNQDPAEHDWDDFIRSYVEYESVTRQLPVGDRVSASRYYKKQVRMTLYDKGVISTVHDFRAALASLDPDYVKGLRDRYNQPAAASFVPKSSSKQKTQHANDKLEKEPEAVKRTSGGSYVREEAAQEDRAGSPELDYADSFLLQGGNKAGGRFFETPSQLHAEAGYTGYQMPESVLPTDIGKSTRNATPFLETSLLDHAQDVTPSRAKRGSLLPVASAQSESRVRHEITRKRRHPEEHSWRATLPPALRTSPSSLTGRPISHRPESGSSANRSEMQPSTKAARPSLAEQLVVKQATDKNSPLTPLRNAKPQSDRYKELCKRKAAARRSLGASSAGSTPQKGVCTTPKSGKGKEREKETSRN